MNESSRICEDNTEEDKKANHDNICCLFPFKSKEEENKNTEELNNITFENNRK